MRNYIEIIGDGSIHISIMELSRQHTPVHHRSMHNNSNDMNANSGLVVRLLNRRQYQLHRVQNPIDRVN